MPRFQVPVYFYVEEKDYESAQATVRGWLSQPVPFQKEDDICLGFPEFAQRWRGFEMGKRKAHYVGLPVITLAYLNTDGRCERDDTNEPEAEACSGERKRV